MRDSVDSIFLVGFELTNAMPMDTGSVEVQEVFHSHFNRIAPACFDPRTRIGLVEGFGVEIHHTISIDWILSGIQVVFSCDTGRGKILVIRVDIELRAWTLEPAAPVIRSRAYCELALELKGFKGRVNHRSCVKLEKFRYLKV